MNNLATGESSVFNKDYANPVYRWYTVGVLMLVYACHAIDRSLPNILVEPVRQEFGLSDTQLGLFTGLAFGLSFAAAAIPVGIISDRSNRRNILIAALLIWSIFTAFGGLARSYVMLILSRVGVGAAEASAAPTAIPMITDIFPAERRSFALGVFYVSPPLGALVASVAGAWIAIHWGWRAAFLFAGLPGIILAVVLFLTVKEPVRGASDRPDGEAPDPNPSAPPLKDIVLYLVKSPSILALIIGIALIGLTSITLQAWTASFFMRIHGLSLMDAGFILGIGGMISIAAPISFGWVADHLFTKDRRWSLRIVWISVLLIFAFGQMGILVDHVALAIFCFIFIDFVRSGVWPPCYAILMSASPVRMRGTIMSIMQMTLNVIGFGVGPLVAGVLSDSYGGAHAIRYSLSTILFLCLLIVPLLMFANYRIFGVRTVRL